MTEINTAEFMRAFDEWTDKTRKTYNNAYRAMVLQLFASIVKRTPVYRGRLRGNWQITVGSLPSNEQLDVRDKGGSQANARAAKAVEYENIDEEYTFIHNNLPYAVTAEFGEWGDGPKTVGGYSKQAPSGMVRVTLTEFEQALNKAARSNQL